MTSQGEQPRSISPFTTSSLLTSLILLLLHNVGAVEPGGACTNAEGKEGDCIAFLSCESLLGSLQVNPQPPAALEFVRRSFCGFQDGDRLVCCPLDGKPPNFDDIRQEVTEDVSQHPNLGLLRQDICGPVYESAVVTGSAVSLNQLPWMALLENSEQEKNKKIACGGTVINDRYVLTAAHCVMNIPRNATLVSVRLGEYNLNSPIDCEENVAYGYQTCAPAPQDIPVEKVIPHPGFIGRQNLQDDIALVRLSRPANFTDDAVKPICLPIGLAQQTEDLIGKHVEVSGWKIQWGVPPSTLPEKWSVRVMPQSQCAHSFFGIFTTSEVTQVCAGGTSSGCYADSGGPMTNNVHIQGRLRTIQRGVMSFGPKHCGPPHNPGVYTLVGHYMKWILDNIEP